MWSLDPGVGSGTWLGTLASLSQKCSPHLPERNYPSLGGPVWSGHLENLSKQFSSENKVKALHLQRSYSRQVLCRDVNRQRSLTALRASQDLLMTGLTFSKSESGAITNPILKGKKQSHSPRWRMTYPRPLNLEGMHLNKNKLSLALSYVRYASTVGIYEGIRHPSS
jgi:hypothetical protein